MTRSIDAVIIGAGRTGARETSFFATLIGHLGWLGEAVHLTRADCPTDGRAIQGDDPPTVRIRGGSCMVGPLGDVQVKPNFDGELIQITEPDRGKYDVDVVRHYARPDVYRLHVTEQAQSVFVPSGGTTYV